MPLPLTPEKDPTYLMELAIARKLSEIDSIRVDLFAATFASQGKATQGAQVRVGWNRSQFRSIARNSIACVNEETAFFEVEVEVPDLRAHAGAMGYLRNSISLLDGFAPYAEIKPLAGDRAGEPRFERTTGTWLYSAIFSAVWTLTNGQPPDLHLIADLPTDITVTLKTARAQPTDFELSQYTEIS